MLNQTLGHYRVLEQIGAGGMGVVYRARDEQLERDVAIKVLPSRVLADEDARKRFRKEALSLARLNHPNIATVHEFGTQGDIDFLVVEYIPGTTLDAKLARGSLTSKEIIDLGVQLARGLAAAHEQGIVHRDLKPANIKIRDDGIVKVLDFGLAKALDSRPENAGSRQAVTVTSPAVTAAGIILGTAAYMAPEQAKGRSVDARR
jgi:serine/threonine protein kinase